MKHQRSLAENAALASTTEEVLKSPQPLRRDKLGRQIFADGSWLDYNALGEPICGSYSLAEWIHQEMQAWRLGREHRISRKPVHTAFKTASRRYPTRICKSYIEGFFSVPEWPRRASDWRGAGSSTSPVQSAFAAC